MLNKVIFCAPNDFCAPATSSILVFSEYLSLLSLAYLVYHLWRIPTLKMKFKVHKSKLEMFRYCGTKNFITKNLRTFLFQFKDIHNIPIM